MDHGSTGDAQEILRRLVSAAGLPDVKATQPINSAGYGLDNQLTRAELQDGRPVLLRRTRVESASPRARVDFLRSKGIATPELYASDDAGASLWEYVGGRTLADVIADGTVTDEIWARVGAALADVHALTFPAPLQGPIGTDSITLRPIDPVEQLQANIASSTPWVEHHQPHLLDVLEHTSRFVTERAAEIRCERPTVLHGDVNLFNIIVTDDSVRLIDWDFPAVGYPLAELSALEEHAYLHGVDGLPPVFQDGYRRDLPTDLLLAYRIIGCLGWLSGDDWAEWEADPTLPPTALSRLRRWHQLLLDWTERIPGLLAAG